MAKRQFTRREMLKIMAAGTAGVAATTYLAGCAPAATPAPADTPTPKPAAPAVVEKPKLKVWLNNSHLKEMDERRRATLLIWGAANNVDVEVSIHSVSTHICYQCIREKR